MKEKTWRRLTRHPALLRCRQALITRVGDRGAIDRAPSAEPPDVTAPRPFREILRRVDTSGCDSLESAIAIAFELSSGHRRGPGIQSSTVDALERIYHRGEGSCSDYSQVFVGLCKAAGVPVREWGASFDAFENHPLLGHSFCEVYSDRDRRWALLDPFHSFRLVEPGTGRPMGVREVLAAPVGGCRVTPIDDDVHPLMKHDPYTITRTLEHPSTIFYVLTENDVFAQDRLRAVLPPMPLPLLHAALLGLGRYPRFRVYCRPDEETAVEARLRELWWALLPFTGAGHDGHPSARARALAAGSTSEHAHVLEEGAGHDDVLGHTHLHGLDLGGLEHERGDAEHLGERPRQAALGPRLDHREVPAR